MCVLRGEEVGGGGGGGRSDLQPCHFLSPLSMRVIFYRKQCSCRIVFFKKRSHLKRFFGVRKQA